jgi:hypothetical protein
MESGAELVMTSTQPPPTQPEPHIRGPRWALHGENRSLIESRWEPEGRGDGKRGSASGAVRGRRRRAAASSPHRIDEDDATQDRAGA